MTEIERIFGEVPSPFPMDKVDEIFDIYKNDTTVLLDLKPGVKIDLFPGAHSHSDYEFLIPYSAMEYVGVEEKKFVLGPQQILPINSDQPHGPKEPMLQVRLFAISMEKSFLSEVSEILFNTEEIYLQNNALNLNEEIVNLIYQFMREYQVQQMGYDII